MAQTGELKLIHGAWRVRFYDSSGVRRMKTLGRLSEFPDKQDVFSSYLAFMAEVNQPKFNPTPGILLRNFVLNRYFPSLGHLRGSTVRNYKGIWRRHIEPRLGHLRLRDIRTFECQQAMEDIVAKNPLKLASVQRIKSFLHEVFSQAVREGLRDGDINPTANIKLNVKPSKTETGAYTLHDVSAMLEVLEDAAKVLTAVAGFTGLRRGEVVGLKWEDYNGDEIQVRRNICFGERGEMVVENPKTEASAAPVPVIRPLKLMLDAWKAKRPITDGSWMFQADYTRKRDHSPDLLDAAQLTPIHPQNILRDVMMPKFEAAKIAWKGYHAFRRGLATNLRALGVDDLTVSEVLRHSDVKVTRDSYIKRVSEKSADAMTKLESKLATGRSPDTDMPLQ